MASSPKLKWSCLEWRVAKTDIVRVQVTWDDVSSSLSLPSLPPSLILLFSSFLFLSSSHPPSSLVWDTSRQCWSQARAERARAERARAPRAGGSLEPSMLEHRSRLGSSRLEHDRVTPCAISRDLAGFVYINPAPVSPSSHLPLSHFNENILLPRPKGY